MSTDAATPAPTPDGGLPAPRFEGALTALALGSALGLLALWLPNYLRWPLYIDAEHFAQIAREWDAGIARPYRDTFCYNWPGPIYLQWVGGKVFGWGKPVSSQAVDALLLLAFCGGTLAWSRRCFGRALPGALALVGLLGFYLNCDFRMTAQRTWQSSLFAAASLMTAQAFAGARGRAASGVLLGLGMLLRPDVAVWGLGVAAVVGVRAGRSGGAARPAFRALAGWSTAVAAVLALGMLPLVAAGIFPDFLRAFRDVISGRVYDPEAARAQTVLGVLSVLPSYEFFRGYNLGPLLVGFPCLWVAALAGGRGPGRASLAVWVATALVAAAGALKAPFFIGYLVQPFLVAVFLTVAPACAALGADARRSRALGAAFLGWLGLSLVPGVPIYCAPGLARETYGALLAGRHVGSPPLYHEAAQAQGDPRQRWADYRECVGYLKRGLPRGFSVVNAVDPFGPYGGLGFVFPTNRKTGGRTNILLLPSVPGRVFEGLLGDVLSGGPTAVVIASEQVAAYAPDAAVPVEGFERRKAQVVRLLRGHYDFAARFGGVEVWTRRRGDPAPSPSRGGSRL